MIYDVGIPFLHSQPTYLVSVVEFVCKMVNIMNISRYAILESQIMQKCTTEFSSHTVFWDTIQMKCFKFQNNFTNLIAT